MKKYPFLEAIGTADEKFLEEVFNDKKDERGQISMSKKKLVTILIAAVLVMSLGVTAAAAGWSRLNQLGDYFEWSKENARLPEELPIINNPEVYAKEVVTSAVTDETEVTEDTKAVSDVEYTPPAPGTAQITTVSMAGRSIYMTIEFNAEGLDIPAELPENANEDMGYCFEWPDTNFHWSGGSQVPASRNGNIFTAVYHWNNVKLPEDEIVIKLQKFGYFGYFYPDKDFVALHDIEVEVKLPVSEINIIEPRKSMNTANIMGADFGVELSAYDLVIYSDFDSLFAAGLVNEDGFSSEWNIEGVKKWDYFDERHLELHMLDGTVFTEEVFGFDNSSHLVTSMSGYRDVEARKLAIVWSFDVPVDVDQIEYIIINDSRFDF